MPKKEPTLTRIVWDEESHLLTTTFANQLMVSHQGGEHFTLTFGEVRPPVDGIKSNEIKILATARIAVPPRAMQAMLVAMAENLARFEGASQGEDD